MDVRPRAQPVVLRAWDVRAILAGGKTALRVPFETQPRGEWALKEVVHDRDTAAWFRDPNGAPWVETCHMGMPGTHLWVRESAYIAPPYFGDVHDSHMRKDPKGRDRIVGYAASMDADSVHIAQGYGVRLTQGSTMPRWASRLLLRITDIQAQRVQDISNAEAVAEGAHQQDTGKDVGGQPLASWSADWPHPRNHEECLLLPRFAVQNVWKRRYRWTKFHEWTWRISFEVVPSEA